MKVDSITLKPGYLLVEQSNEEVETTGGIVFEENTDDFVVYAKVINSSSEKYPVGEFVVFHVLETDSIRDQLKAYSMIQEDKILGTYVPPQKEVEEEE